MYFLAAMTETGWRPGWGDPDFLGWAITVTYFLVACLCAWAGTIERFLAIKKGGAERPYFWMSLMLLLLVLGLNKQLDLQCWLILTGRTLAHGGEWAAIAMTGVTLLLTAFCVTFAMARYIGWPWRRYLLALVGVVYLAMFVVMRAGDVVPGMREINYRYYELIHLTMELGATLMIGACAARAIGRDRRKRFARRAVDSRMRRRSDDRAQLSAAQDPRRQDSGTADEFMPGRRATARA